MPFILFPKPLRKPVTGFLIILAIAAVIGIASAIPYPASTVGII